MLNQRLGISKPQGFTLIELMIVIAIVGILAGIAIPSYQDYSTRTKVSEAIVIGSGLKPQLANYFASQGSFPTNNTTLGYTSTGTELAGKYVSAIVITGTSTAWHNNSHYWINVCSTKCSPR